MLILDLCMIFVRTNIMFGEFMDFGLRSIESGMYGGIIASSEKLIYGGFRSYL